MVKKYIVRLSEEERSLLGERLHKEYDDTYGDE